MTRVARRTCIKVSTATACTRAAHRDPVHTSSSTYRGGNDGKYGANPRNNSRREKGHEGKDGEGKHGGRHALRGVARRGVVRVGAHHGVSENRVITDGTCVRHLLIRRAPPTAHSTYWSPQSQIAIGPYKGRSLRARRTVSTVQIFSESVRCGHAIPRTATSSLVIHDVIITSRDEFIISHDEL